MSKKLLSGVALTGILLSLTACGDDPEQEETDAADSAAESELGDAEQMPEADTSDVPDVVAEVNGEELTGEEFTAVYEAQFQQLAMQAQMTGEEPDQDELRSQTLDSMIDNELLIQEAENSGFEASDDDVEELLEETAEMNGMETVDDLIAGYEDQGLSEEQLREDARKQVLIDQLLDDLDVEEPTEDELEEAYDESVAQMEAQQEMLEESGEAEEDAEEPEIPDFEDQRDDIEEQLTSERTNEAAQDLVEELREDAEIETHL